MRLLALETATDLVGAAVVDEGGTVVERSHPGGRAHGELLAPAVAEVCALSGCTLADVTALAVDVGPGLFTGLRVGVATAKALGQALGLGVVTVTSLDVLAAAAGEVGGPERAATVVSVVDARRGEVFCAAYRFGGRAGPAADPAAGRDDRPEAVAPAELAAWVEELGAAGPVLVVGDGAVRHLDLLVARPGADLGLAAELTAPPPAVLARLAARRLAAGARPVPAADVVPDYRRHADARIHWEERTPRRSGSGAPP